MTDTHETTADVIAEIRALSNPISDGIIAINGRSIANRLEAAHRRERGDCAKLREALKECLLYIACAESVGIGTITLNDKVKLNPKKIIKSAKEVLAATEKEGGNK